MSQHLTVPGQAGGFGRFVPGVASIADGVRNSAGVDLRAALTVWAVVVPQSLAYATLAGVPSVHGLYAAVAALAAYAIFGTCRDLNMGAESTVALMAAATIAPLVTDADSVIALSALAALLVGGWCVLGFVFRLGFISDFLSRPILAGYVFGSGIIIVLSQLEALFGLDIDSSLYVTDIGGIVRNIGDADGLTTAIGLTTVVLVFGMRKLVPSVPAPLVAVVLGIVAATAFDLADEGVAVVGNITSGIPVPGLPDASFDQFTQLLLPALGIALLAYPDSFLTARSLATTGGYKIDADQEFLAIGASNVAAGFFQGFPVNGSQSRSYVQRDAGGKSNLVGLICSALVLITLLFLTGLFEQLPLAVLSGIVIVAGLGLFDIRDFRKLWGVRRSEFWLGVTTVASVLVLGMLGGIAFAIGLSLIVALARLVRPHTAELGLVEGTDTFRDLARHSDAHPIPDLLIYRVDDELFFANTTFFVSDVKHRLVTSDPPDNALLIDAEGMSDIDTTATQQVGELLDELDAAGIEVLWARVRQPVLDMLERSGLLDQIGEDHIFLEVDDAVTHYLADHDTGDPSTEADSTGDADTEQDGDQSQSPRREEQQMDPNSSAADAARSRLRAERERAEARLRTLEHERDEDGAIDAAGGDPGADTTSAATYLGAIEDVHKEIEEIDLALRRVDDGTYGIDEVTGEPIDPARLEAEPTARLNVGTRLPLV